MADLNIKIETGDGAAKLAELNAGLDDIAKTAPGAGAGLEKAVEGIEKVGPAAKAAAADVKDLAKELDAAGKVDTSHIAENFKGIGEGAKSVGDSSPSIRAATQAFEGLMQQAGGLDGVMSKLAGNFGAIGQGAVGVAAGMEATTASFAGFAAVAGGLPAILAAVTLGIGALYSALSEGSQKVGQAVENLQRQVNAFSKNAADAPAALEKLNEIAFTTGYSVEKLERAYGKYIITAQQFGLSSKKAAENFDLVAIAAKSIGASEEKVTTMLNSWDRGMANGTLTARLFGNSLQQVGFSVQSVDKALVGMAYNTKISVAEIQQVINKLGEMFPASKLMLTMAEYNQRLTNSFRDMQASFAVGQLAAEGTAMKHLTETVKEFQPELNQLSRGLGELGGMFHSLFDYLEAIGVAAFGGLLRIINSLAGTLDILTFGALSGLVSALGVAGSAVIQFGSDLGSYIGQGVTIALAALRKFSEYIAGEATYIWKAFVKEMQEDWPLIQRGAQTTADIIIEAFRAMSPIWAAILDGMKSAWDTAWTWMKQRASDFIAQIKREWGELKVMLGVGPSTAGIDNWNKHLEDTSKMIDKVKDKLGTLNNPYIIPNQPRPQWMNDAWNEGKPGKMSGERQSRTRTEGITDKYGEPLGPSGIGQDQYQRPGGVYSGNDLIYGTGAYDQREGAQFGPGYGIASHRNDPMRGGQVGPQEQFNGINGPGQSMPVYLTDKNGVTGPDAFGSKQPFTPDAVNAGTDNTRQFVDSIKSTFADGFSQFRAEGADIVEALAGLGEDIGNSTQGYKDVASVLDHARDSFDSGNKDLFSALNEVTQGDNAVVQSLDAMGNAIDANTTATDTNNSLTNTNNFWTQQETVAQEKNTAATQLDTAANLIDAAAQGSGGGSSGGGGGGGGAAPNQSSFGNNGTNPSLYLDTGGIVGSWGGRMGPGLPASAWVGAPHFAGGGMTGGGIPVVAHPGEAIIPLEGGAVPVHLSGGDNSLSVAILQRSASILQQINQSIKDVRETSINCCTLLDQDLLGIIDAVNGVDDDVNALRGSMSSFLSSHSNSLTSIAGSSAMTASNTAGGNKSQTDGTGSIMIRGWWGTSNQGGYLPASALQKQLAAKGLLGQDKQGIYGSGAMGTAADGMVNTNMIPGMTSLGAAITVHPNEAIIPLPDGRSVPVVIQGGWGGQAPGAYRGGGGGQFAQPPARGTVINVTNINVRDPQHYMSKDQLLKELVSGATRASCRIGYNNPIDDPTRKQGQSGWGGQAPGAYSAPNGAPTRF